MPVPPSFAEPMEGRKQPWTKMAVLCFRSRMSGQTERTTGLRDYGFGTLNLEPRSRFKVQGSMFGPDFRLWTLDFGLRTTPDRYARYWPGTETGTGAASISPNVYRPGYDGTPPAPLGPPLLAPRRSAERRRAPFKVRGSRFKVQGSVFDVRCPGLGSNLRSPVFHLPSSVLPRLTAQTPKTDAVSPPRLRPPSLRFARSLRAALPGNARAGGGRPF